jgi:hypothetical protein
MNASLKFKFIGQNTFKLLQPIVKNQNILRYIKYLDKDDPLDKKLPDIDMRTDLITDGTIILTPFDKNVLAKEKIKIFFNPIDVDFGDGKNILNTTYYTIDIIMPTSKWKLSNGEFRAYMIAHEIAKEIDNKNIAGIGKVNIVGRAIQGKVTDTFSGLNFKIAVDSANKSVNKG